VITPRELPRDVVGDSEICLTLPQQGGNLTEILEDLERQLIIQTLRQQGASQTRAADILGIARTTLRYKMEKYGLIDRQD
jgi:DNA-binding NtrC family response regulator